MSSSPQQRQGAQLRLRRRWQAGGTAVHVVERDRERDPLPAHRQWPRQRHLWQHHVLVERMDPARRPGGLEGGQPHDEPRRDRQQRRVEDRTRHRRADGLLLGRAAGVLEPLRRPRGGSFRRHRALRPTRPLLAVLGLQPEQDRPRLSADVPRRQRRPVREHGRLADLQQQGQEQKWNLRQARHRPVAADPLSGAGLRAQGQRAAGPEPQGPRRPNPAAAGAIRPRPPPARSPPP